jgi:outer membrane protein assembly factor BamB
MSGPNAYGNDNALNSSGDIYVAGQTGYSGTTQCLLLKYNTSGSLLWQRELGDPSKDQGWQKIAIDGSGNVYCAGYCNVTSDADILLAKYNSSGALQWQRRFGRSGAGDYCNGLTVDSDGNLYFCSSISTNNGDMLVANLPSDGSGMGTYSVNGTSFTYAITSLTDTTPTYTHDAEAFAAGGNLSNTGQQNTNLTDGNLSLTSVVTQI